MTLAIFYHVYQVLDWRALVNEQVGKMRDAGLWDRADHIHIGVNGTEPMPVLEPAEIHVNQRLDSEGDTLRALRDYAHTTDAKILYLHTKGVTRPESIPVYEWRLLMEYFCVERWQECVELLDRVGAVGINLNAQPQRHFSGNFWWATSEHIRGLDDAYLVDRMDQELWVATAGDLHELHQSGLNQYIDRYPPELYRA